MPADISKIKKQPLAWRLFKALSAAIAVIAFILVGGAAVLFYFTGVMQKSGVMPGGGNGLTTSMKPVDIFLNFDPQNKHPDFKPAHLRIPLAYLQMSSNWRGGDQTMVIVNFDYPEMKPASFELQKSDRKSGFLLLKPDQDLYVWLKPGSINKPVSEFMHNKYTGYWKVIKEDSQFTYYQRVAAVDDNGSPPDGPLATDYTRLVPKDNPHPEIETYIECQAGNEHTCLVTANYNDKILISNFDMPKANLAHWAEYDKKVRDLIASFYVNP